MVDEGFADERVAAIHRHCQCEFFVNYAAKWYESSGKFLIMINESFQPIPVLRND